MKTLILAGLVVSLGGCAALKAGLKVAEAPLVLCVDQAAMDAAGQMLPAVTVILNDPKNPDLQPQLLALEGAGKQGVLCAVEALASSAEGQLKAPPSGLLVAPQARIRAVHYLAFRVAK